jgi:signal transduction histidine kinase
MGYTETLMASGETIVRRAHQHWFVLIANARAAIIALVIAALLGVFEVWSGVTGTLFTILGWIVLILFVFGIAKGAWGIFQFRNQEYLVTSRRLIHAEGVINKRASDSSLEKINDAVLTESVFGRMFGFGDLEVLTASETGNENLRMLRDAKSFKKAMLEAKHELEIDLSRPTAPAMRAPDPVAAPPAPVVPVAPAPVAAPDTSMTADEVSASIERLVDMRDRGLITPEEFEAKRTEMLARL